MLNIDQHLLTKLIEECSEIQKRACKALVFGIDDRDVTLLAQGIDAQTERERLWDEINDLVGVVEMMCERGTFPAELDRAKVEAKKAKVLKFMQYSRQRGELEPEVPLFAS
jgi:hypothetical protein